MNKELSFSRLSRDLSQSIDCSRGSSGKIIDRGTSSRYSHNGQSPVRTLSVKEIANAC